MDEQENYSNGGKALADLIGALKDTGTGNEMTPEEIVSHKDVDTHNGEELRYTNDDADKSDKSVEEMVIDDYQKAFASLRNDELNR